MREGQRKRNRGVQGGGSAAVKKARKGVEGRKAGDAVPQLRSTARLIRTCRDMSGGTASGGSGGVRGTGAECRKFAPNIFNKSKCSSCFKQKEEHSAEALECNRVSFT